MDGFDAIVLAGGTARRLGGVPKHTIEFEGRTLLERTLAAVVGARRVVVVGDDSLQPLVGDATVVQEEPPRAGPAAGIGAALPHVTADRVVVLACDHPYVADAIDVLLQPTGGDGLIAIDAGGQRQNLLFSSSRAALQAAADRQDDLVGLAVHTLLEPLDLAEIPVPELALRDIDTWQDLGHDE
jgi:molybdopterin-guanine dinucleotide biosynthesis protein A